MAWPLQCKRHILGREFFPSSSPSSQNWCALKLTGVYKVIVCKQPVSEVLAYAIRFIPDLLPYSASWGGEGIIFRLHNPGSCWKEERRRQALSLTSTALGALLWVRLPPSPLQGSSFFWTDSEFIPFDGGPSPYIWVILSPALVSPWEGRKQLLTLFIWGLTPCLLFGFSVFLHLCNQFSGINSLLFKYLGYFVVCNFWTDPDGYNLKHQLEVSTGM